MYIYKIEFCEQINLKMEEIIDYHGYKVHRDGRIENLSGGYLGINRRGCLNMTINEKDCKPNADRLVYSLFSGETLKESDRIYRKDLSKCNYENLIKGSQSDKNRYEKARNQVNEVTNTELEMKDNMNQPKNENPLPEIAIKKERKKRIPYKIEQYDLEGTHIRTWESVDKIVEELGHSKKRIAQTCHGDFPDAYKHIWRYQNQLQNIDDFSQIICADRGTFTKYKISKEGIVINDAKIVIAPYLQDGQYKTHITNDDGVKHSILTHRLVAETFLPNPYNWEFVHRIDGIGYNLSNLEWVP